MKAAARLRLRPIIMTSLAFSMGMVPLVLSSGAGAASRIAVGTGVMGGMIAATALGIFIIPALYLLVRQRTSAARNRCPAEHRDEQIDTLPGETVIRRGARPMKRIIALALLLGPR